MSTAPLLAVDDLHVRFKSGQGDVHAVRGVSFAIREGETLAVVGESGSGKSVTALSILQLLPYPLASHGPASSIRFEGEELMGAKPHRLRQIRELWGDEIDDPDRRFAARLVEDLYSEDDSPLQYRINRLGGRSQQDKWILQAELFNELHRWVSAEWKKIRQHTTTYREGEKYYGMIRDFFKAAQRVWGDAWDNDGYMVTKPVTIKAMVRVCADLARADADPADGRVKRWEERLAPWSEKQREFRSDGFYERFAAKSDRDREQKRCCQSEFHVHAAPPSE